MSLLINKHLKYGQMVTLLESLKYVRIRTAGPHNVFKHANSESVIVLSAKKRSQDVPVAIQASIVNNILKQGVSTEEELKNALSSIK